MAHPYQSGRAVGVGIRVKMTGFKELRAQLKELGPEIQAHGLRSAVFAGARVVREAAVRSMTPGRSNPGEPPGIRYGVLKASIATKRLHTPPHIARYLVFVRGNKLTKITRRRKGFKKGKYGSVAPPSVYGKFLEFGTSKMAARPFMAPAYFNNIDLINARIKEGLQRAIKRALKKHG